MPQKSEKSTVFVIGAGASNEVNMPTGHTLKDAIAKSLAFTVDHRVLRGGDEIVREAISQLAGRSGGNEKLGSYIEAARLISDAMPLAVSIDNFIDSHRADPIIAECGKVAIASEILKAEHRSTLHVDPSNIHNKLKFKYVETTWFNAFFQLLTLNTELDALPERLRRVKVVSFNYDRTFEHFLHCAIQNYYGCTSDKAAAVLNSLVILHPYGRVGALPWQEGGAVAVPYGSILTRNALLSVASTLRTFTEGTDIVESQIMQIRNTVFDADTLVFLGFAYLELNLELLFGITKIIPMRSDKRVFGTAMGLSESNKKVIAAELADLGRYSIDQITLRKELSAAAIFSEYSRSLKL